MGFLVKIEPQQQTELEPATKMDAEESGTFGLIRRPIGSESNDADNGDVSRQEKTLLLRKKSLLNMMMGGM